MNTEQHARNQASTAMLEKMAAFVDELLQEREQRRELEESYQGRIQWSVITAKYRNATVITGQG